MLRMKPTVVQKFTDNGTHSHWELIDVETGIVLWEEPKWDGSCAYPGGCGKRKGKCDLAEPCEMYVPRTVAIDVNEKAFVNITATKGEGECIKCGGITALLRKCKNCGQHYAV